VKFEVTPIDNKLSPAESLNALKAAIDQGARYIVQGNGSSVALALSDAVAKHNERNPGKEVLYLNYAAVDPDLTNSKCSYWHFRFDADTSMKMEAMTTFMKEQKPTSRRSTCMNQNYSHGVQVAKYAKETLARKRPDIQIVGEDLHPLAQVRDFAPYIAKIKASGADTVITGNWGSDLSLLIKAANEAGYNGKFSPTTPASPARPPRWALAARAGLPDRLQPLQHARADAEVAGRVQEEVQRRLLHRLHDPRLRDAGRGDGQGQVHRPGQGGGWRWKASGQELQRRSRDAQDRPPAAAAAVHDGVGRRPTRSTPTAPRTPA
jgi:hypothetical protein